jgi:hypothetical protein
MESLIPIEEWLVFVDQGLVFDSRVLQIAQKIQQQQPLNLQEIAMYEVAHTRIEAQLRSGSQA